MEPYASLQSAVACGLADPKGFHESLTPNNEKITLFIIVVMLPKRVEGSSELKLISLLAGGGKVSVGCAQTPM